MAKQRTEKCTFKSRYAEDTWVTPAQYLCEFICEKKAIVDGTDLPHHFWQLETWAKFYRSQVHTANKLLKTYSIVCLLASLKDKRARRTYSLRAKWLIPIFDEYQKALDSSAKNSYIEEAKRQLPKDPKNVVTRKEQKKKTILDEL